MGSTECCHDGSTQMGILVSEKNNEGIERFLRVQTLSQQGTIHGSGRRKEGEWVAHALRLTHIIAVRSITGSQRTQPLARMDIAVFDSCMMTMDEESWELTTLTVCRISTSGCHGHGDHRRQKNQAFKTRGSIWSVQMGHQQNQEERESDESSA